MGDRSLWIRNNTEKMEGKLTAVYNLYQTPVSLEHAFLGRPISVDFIRKVKECLNDNNWG